MHAMSGNELSVKLNNAKTFRDPEFKLSIAYSVGGMFYYFLNNRTAFLTGLSYDRTSVKVIYNVSNNMENLDLTQNFLFMNIPMGIHYYLDPLVFLGGGIYYGKSMGADGMGKYSSSSASADLDKTKDEGGIFIDAGYNLNVTSNSNFLILLRYKVGLNKVYTEPDIITDVQTKALLLNIAYGIKF